MIKLQTVHDPNFSRWNYCEDDEIAANLGVKPWNDVPFTAQAVKMWLFFLFDAQISHLQGREPNLGLAKFKAILKCILANQHSEKMHFLCCFSLVGTQNSGTLVERTNDLATHFARIFGVRCLQLCNIF